MFRSRSRTETPSRPTAKRGSVGSARIWDAAMRERGREWVPEVAPVVPPEPLAVGSEELAALITGIVQVTLDTRLADCEPGRRAELVREMEARLREHFGLESRTPPPRPRSAPEDVPPESVDPEPSAARYGTASFEPWPLAVRTLATALEERLQHSGGALAGRPDLRHRLVELALEGLLPPAEKPSNEESEASSEELGALDVMQRRASKLERSLADARAALAYVSGLEHVDPGIASIYRVVQGLAEADPLREDKKALLESVFQANLAIQKR